MTIVALRTLLFALLPMSGVAPASSGVARQEAASSRIRPASVAKLAASIAVRYESFTLPNGLRVVVHTDRSVRTVGVQVDYDVGSSSEPEGRTGFAHLFEHLMFNGSENAPEDYSAYMRKLGATINGVTQFDRTAYSNDVPTPGLERTLFLESDRMGYLLGALNRTELDEQRGVVQNEKRMREDGPLATMRARVQARVYPVGHPYSHDIMGSMADLDAASIEDVRSWFRAHYGPNNAVLALTGDIDVATARRLAAKYFGAIPAGPRSERPPTPVPSLPKRLDETTTDRIPGPYLYRSWAVPGLTAPDAAALQIAAGTMALADGTSLRDRLVGREKMFRTLSIALEQFDAGGVFIVHGPVAAGVDAAVAGRALDAAILAAARTEPSPVAIERYLTGELTARITETAMTSGGVGQVVNGLRMGRGPEWYRTSLNALTAQTPASVVAAATRWLDRPPYALTVLPGPAPVRQLAASGPRTAAAIAPLPVKGTRGALPPEGAFTDIAFPKAEHARLSNGMELVHLRNSGAPLTDIHIDFDVGSVDDPVDAPGTQAMTLALLDKGTTSRDLTTIDRDRERMGATIGFEADADRTTVSLSVPTANLRPGADLIADMLRRPAFAPAAIDAARADVRDARAADGNLLDRLLRQRMNPASPYLGAAGSSYAKSVDRLSAEDLRTFHSAWLRPDKATIFAVSDAPIDRVRSVLERSFGDWLPVGRAGVRVRPADPRPPVPGIVLVDLPGSDQATIAGGQAVTTPSPDERLAANVANDALAGDGSGRLARDLRETKGWTYGVSGQFDVHAMDTEYRVMAPVQQDRAGASIALMRDHLAGFVGARPMSKEEFDAAIENRIRSMSITYSGPRSFMDAIRANRRLGLPEDADATLTGRYRAMTLEQARAAFRTAVDPARFVWIVGGDAAKLRPQLETLGLPITLERPDADASK